MNTYENCWQILGIEPVRDKKTIKRAYSKLLKITRPDEDPEGFKCLHTAYTEALEYLDTDWYWEEYEEYDELEDEDNEEQEIQSAEQLPTPLAETIESIYNLEATVALVEINIDDMQTVVAPIATPTKCNNESHESESQLEYVETPIAEAKTHDEVLIEDNIYQECVVKNNPQDIYNQRQALYASLERLLQNAIKRNTLLEWKTLLADDTLYDITFKKEVAMSVLENILDLRLSQIEQTSSNSNLPPSYVAQSILLYLNDFFGWQYVYEQIQNHFYYHDALHQFYEDLEPAEQKSNYKPREDYHDHTDENDYILTSLHKRFFAFSIDMIILFLFAKLLLVITVFFKINTEFSIIILFLPFIIHIFIQYKNIHHQASIGQKMLGIKMIDGQGQNVTVLELSQRLFLALFILALVMTILFVTKFVGMLICSIYLIYKYYNKDYSTWLDTNTNTYIVNND